MDTDMRRSLLFARVLPTGCAMHHAELVAPACGQSLYIGKSRQLGSAPYSSSSFASLADAMSANLKTTVRPAIPRTVWLLGFVSLFMDLSTKLVHALLLVFLVGTVTMSVVALGLLEGAAKATAQIIKLFCGPLSDYLGRRKGLLLPGYGLAAFAKPFLADLLLGTGRSVVSVFVSVVVWGAYGFHAGQSRRHGDGNRAFNSSRCSVPRIQPGLRPLHVSRRLARRLAVGPLWLIDHLSNRRGARPDAVVAVLVRAAAGSTAHLRNAYRGRQ
jgi:hypothetical protein